MTFVKSTSVHREEWREAMDISFLREAICIQALWALCAKKPEASFFFWANANASQPTMFEIRFDAGILFRRRMSSSAARTAARSSTMISGWKPEPATVISNLLSRVYIRIMVMICTVLMMIRRRRRRRRRRRLMMMMMMMKKKKKKKMMMMMMMMMTMMMMMMLMMMMMMGEASSLAHLKSAHLRT